MQKLLFFITIFGVVIFLSCHKESPNEPPQVTIQPQVDIPWPSLANSPWPMFHHDPQSTGRSQYPGPRKGKIKWTFKPGGAIYSAVVIGTDSTIYFPCEGIGLYALYPNGNLKWKLSLPLASDHQPLVAADGTIFLVTGPSFDSHNLNSLYAINPDGSIKNRFDFDFAPWSSLNIGIDGTLYLTSVSGPQLYAVSQQGTILWSFSLPNGGWGAQNITISPDGKILYLFDYVSAYRITGLYAVGIDGQLQWHYSIEDDQTTLHSSLVDSDGNIYFGTFGISDSCGFYSISSTGRLNWKYDGLIQPEPTMDLKGHLFFDLALGECKLTSIDFQGNLRWQTILEDGANLAAYICDHEGFIYHCAANSVNAYDSNGNLLWHVPFVDAKATRIACPAIGYDGTLYVGTRAGDSRLYAIE